MSLCLSAALAALMCPAALPASAVTGVQPMIGHALPAYLYDPDQSSVVRRRPGHPTPGSRRRIGPAGALGQPSACRRTASCPLW